MADEVEIGRVNDYFAHINVAGIDLTAPLKVGDRVRIKGHTTDMSSSSRACRSSTSQWRRQRSATR